MIQKVGEQRKLSNKPSIIRKMAKKGEFQMEGELKLNTKPSSDVIGTQFKSKGEFQIGDTKVDLNTTPSPIRSGARVPMAEDAQPFKTGRDQRRGR